MSVEAYPLQWPADRPRTPESRRERAKFGKASVFSENTYTPKKPMELGDALNRLRGELSRLGARNVVVSSNVPTRGDGMPYARAAAPKDPGVAVYFQLDREPMALACDLFNRIADNVAAIAKHIDAMRGMSRWGVGTTKQLFSGFRALPPRGGTVGSDGPDWWTVMGLHQSASLDEIETAYRALAMKYHPDRAGGDAGAMASINRARDQARAARGAA